MMWDNYFESLLRGALPFLEDSEKLTSDADLGDLGLDSLETVGLLMALEEHYAIVFPDEALMMDTFSTPGKLWTAVDALVCGSDEAVDVGAGD